MTSYYPTFSEPSIDKQRYKLLLISILAIFVIIIIRLWYLQIIRGNDFENISKRNHVREVQTPAPRGIIYDRRGDAILNNRLYFSLVYIPQYAPTKEMLAGSLKKVSQLLEIPEQTLWGRIDKAKGLPKFHPVKIVPNLNPTQVEIIESIKMRLYGIDVQVEPKRDYHKNLPHHLIGYLREINKEEIIRYNKIVKKNYKMGDYIGKIGIEKVYETYLKGIEGRKYFKVDAYGRKTSADPIIYRNLEGKKQIPGNNLTLTIDFDLQKVAKKAFTQYNGVVLAVDPRNGEILVHLSNPTFDPKIYVDGLTPQKWKVINQNLHNPLLDRTTGGIYPPGSTWKPFVLLAALEEGIINEQTTFNCPGGFRLGRRYYNCWKRSGHQHANYRKSLKESCDVYYYNIGSRVHIDILSKYAKIFGFGEKTGLNLNNELSGNLPTSEWKQKTFLEPWVPGDTISIVIGQGYTTVTPLQLIMAYAALANNGNLHHPMILKKITNHQGDIIKENTPRLKRKIPINPKHLNMVIESLCAVVNEQHGTGVYAKLNNITVCGKTGTAQNASLKKTKNQEDLSFHYKDHAWFVAFAPKEKPEIVVLVLAEFIGGHGGSIAAPVTRKILYHYFNRDLSGIKTNELAKR